MKFKTIGCAALVAGAALTANAQDKPANHLILSEVVINSIAESSTGSSEYVEIFNPTDSAIPLDNYYVTDWAQWFNFPIFYDNDQIPDLGGGDYVMRFPTGSSIPSGGVVVVCWHANSFAADFFGGNLANYFSQPGSPQLFETAESNATVPNMISYNSSTSTPESGTNFSHTNVGEFVELAYYDGVSDLVKDVDFVSWGSAAASGGDTVPQRSGTSSDGPDPDSNVTDYLFDGGVDGRNVDVDPMFDPNSVVRLSTIELGESNSVGNGNLGQDETLEWCFDTWIGCEGDGGSVGEEDEFLTPGLPGSLKKNNDNPAPWLGAVSRSVKDPAPGTTFDITCRAGAAGTATVKLWLDPGTGTYAAQNMTFDSATQTFKKTVGPYTEGKHLRYYFEVFDGALANRFPLGGGMFGRENESDHYNLHIHATPVTENDVMINELQFNPVGGDNTTNAEWVELYNTRATPIDISGWHYSDASSNAERCVFPDNCIIPGNGFFILSCENNRFLALYPYVSPASMVELHDTRTNALPGHDNGGDSPALSRANDFRWLNRPTVPMDLVVYDDSAEDPTWPNMQTTGATPHYGNTGRTDELKSPTLDNNVGSNWAISTNALGSPMAINQQASVSDWSIY